MAHSNHYYCGFCRKEVKPVCTPVRSGGVRSGGVRSGGVRSGGVRSGGFIRVCEVCGGHVYVDAKMRKKVPVVDGVIRAKGGRDEYEVSDCIL